MKHESKGKRSNKATSLMSAVAEPDVRTGYFPARASFGSDAFRFRHPDQAVAFGERDTRPQMARVAFTCPSPKHNM